MNVRKRITTLLLAICLVLSLVPAVSAAATDDVVYNFDYYTAIGENVPVNDTTVKGTCTLIQTNGEVISNLAGQIRDFYSDESGLLNWCYYDSQLSYPNNKGAMFVKEGFTTGNHTMQCGYYRGVAAQGDWVAFKIKNPGAGITRRVDISYPAHKCGVELCNIYILPVTEDVNGAMESENKIGTANFYNSSSGGSSDYAKYAPSTSAVGLWTPGSADEYIVVFEAERLNPDVAKSLFLFCSLTMTADKTAIQEVEDAEVAMLMRSGTSNVTTLTTLEAAISNSATVSITLVKDVTSAADITIPAGVTLDLNGKTLNANVNDAAGTLIDSTGGDGKVKAATLTSVGSDQMVLADGDYLRIFDYTLTTPAAPVEVSQDGNSVHFWFDVRFDNAEAYKVIAAGNSGFSVGAYFQWNEDEAMKVDFGAGLSVENWALQMQTDPNLSFYVKVNGLKSASESGILSVLPKISGKQGGGSIDGLTYEVK